MAKNQKTSKSTAIVFIAATLVLAVGIVLLLLPGKGSGDGNPETTVPYTKYTAPSVPLVELAEDTYERWLVASMYMVLPLEYPDAQDINLYVASANALEDKALSKGAYVRFISEGKTVVLRSLPLDQERTEAGTKDLSSMLLGFSTFEVVPEASVDLGAMTPVLPGDLQVLLEQSLLVSLYEH